MPSFPGRGPDVEADGSSAPFSGDGRLEPGRSFLLRDGSGAVLLGRTVTGRYAYAVPSVAREDGRRPLVRTMTAPQAFIVLGPVDPEPRPTRDRRGPWART